MAQIFIIDIFSAQQAICQQWDLMTNDMYIVHCANVVSLRCDDVDERPERNWTFHLKRPKRPMIVCALAKFRQSSAYTLLFQLDNNSKVI